MSKDEVRNKESIDEESDGKEESSIGEDDYLYIMCRGRRVQWFALLRSLII